MVAKAGRARQRAGAGRRAAVGRLLPWLLAALALLWLGPMLQRASGPEPALLAPAEAPPAPALDGAWVNGPPQRLEALRGRVVLLELWAGSCRYCRRSRPWLEALQARLGPRGLVPVSVHSALLDSERSAAAVRAAAAALGLRQAVMNDADGRYFRALHARGLPAFFLLDRAGRVRAAFSGETRQGSARARAIESALERLLAEPPPRPPA